MLKKINAEDIFDEVKDALFVQHSGLSLAKTIQVKGPNFLNLAKNLFSNYMSNASIKIN